MIVAEQVSIRVLYIEDDPIVGELFKAAVEAHGYLVDLAYSGGAGLERFGETPYDVVAVDFDLPDMTGIDIARKLLLEEPDLPMLMVTGRGNERLAVEALTLGVSNYVVKDGQSVFLELIPSIISHLIERKRKHEKAKKIDRRQRVSISVPRDYIAGLYS